MGGFMTRHNGSIHAALLASGILLGPQLPPT